MHRHLTIHHGKHLLTVVDVPDIGLVGPVQAHGGAGKIGNVQRAPRAVGLEGAGVKYFHGVTIAFIVIGVRNYENDSFQRFPRKRCRPIPF